MRAGCRMCCAKTMRIVQAVFGVVAWFILRNVYYHLGKAVRGHTPPWGSSPPPNMLCGLHMQSLLFAFVCGATYPNVIRAALFIASMVATFSAAALHMRRPYRFAWVPFAVIASVELLALYCYQFRLFKPGNEWYSGARASIEYWGFNRADAEYNPGA